MLVVVLFVQNIINAYKIVTIMLLVLPKTLRHTKIMMPILRPQTHILCARLGTLSLMGVLVSWVFKKLLIILGQVLLMP